MIIQHNVTAMNAHRQLFNNNMRVAKNLEKLSSGYKINRAGDDAAGLGNLINNDEDDDDFGDFFSSEETQYQSDGGGYDDDADFEYIDNYDKLDDF